MDDEEGRARQAGADSLGQAKRYERDPAGRTVDDVRDQTDRLRGAAPASARRLEQDDGRFAEPARDANLSDRTQRFVDEVPERLRGGSPAQALRSAATRGVAYLATGVLSILFLLHGPKQAAAAASRSTTRRGARRTVRVGPFLTAAGAFAGLELYGLGGALLAVLAVLAVALAVAALDELAPPRTQPP